MLKKEHKYLMLNNQHQTSLQPPEGTVPLSLTAFLSNEIKY